MALKRKFLNSSFFGRKNVVLLALSFFLLLPNFLPFGITPLASADQKQNWDSFEPVLSSRLLSVQAILAYTDSLADERNVEPNTLGYGELLTSVIKQKFFHGFSHYALDQNWIAAVAGKLVWYDLSAIVIPEDIIKYPMAACSQQGIVLMECLRRKGIAYRKIIFDHHFAVEAYLNGWYYFDPNMEPDFTQIARSSLQDLIDTDRLFEVYSHALNQSDVALYLANPAYGEINGPQARNATVFQSVSKMASRVLWLLPLSIMLMGRYRRNAHPGTKAIQTVYLSPAGAGPQNPMIKR
jgi:hypothetical protein